MRAAALVLTLLAAACTAQGLARRDYLNTLVGDSEAEVVRRMGPPDGVDEDEAHRYLYYAEQRASVLAVGYPVARPAAIVVHGCDTRLDLVRGRVVRWSLRGDACAR